MDFVVGEPAVRPTYRSFVRRGSNRLGHLFGNLVFAHLARPLSTTITSNSIESTLLYSSQACYREMQSFAIQSLDSPCRRGPNESTGESINNHNLVTITNSILLGGSFPPPVECSESISRVDLVQKVEVAMVFSQLFPVVRFRNLVGVVAPHHTVERRRKNSEWTRLLPTSFVRACTEDRFRRQP